MGPTRIAALGAVAFAVVACTTITEQMPTRPNPVGGGNPVPLPVVVVPVPVPSPNNPAPNPNPAPANPSNPNPNPAPPPDAGGGIPPDVPDNTSPAVKLAAKVYFIECDGVPIPDSGYATEALIGCRVHLDVTPKDASNKPTQLKNPPQWSYSDTSIISVTSSNPYNPAFIARAPGTVTAYCEADGLRSNDVTISLHH